ncbi:MAG: hypothetical protein K5639_04495 [Eubacterium sp.]|nr:hypothetical protein [Eubacterium sp.]
MAFTKVYDEQRALHGRTRETILNTIGICKDKNIMKQYFEKRETEVISMYMTLYDDETILRNHDAQLTRDVTKQVTKEATTSEREGILKELIEDGTITEEKADAIREKRKASTMI